MIIALNYVNNSGFSHIYCVLYENEKFNNLLINHLSGVLFDTIIIVQKTSCFAGKEMSYTHQGGP